MPSITLTATLQDVTGATVGSAANPSKLCIALCGFGAYLPRVGGTSLIARVGPIYLESTTGTFSTALWGNDAITPAGTYYTIALLDGQGNVVQSGAYQLTGAGTFDLSSLLPITTPSQAALFLSALIGNAPTFQVATGTVNSVNTVFTFTAPQTPTPVLAVFAGGIYQTPVTDYGTPTYSGSNVWSVTLTTAPALGPVSVFLFQQIGSGDRTITVSTTVVVTGANQDHCLYSNLSAPTSQAIPNAGTAGLGYELAFVDVSYTAATNPITITCAGGINAGTSYVLNRNGGAVTLRSDGSVWRVKSVV
jgi:hypothetical protein